MQLIPSIDLRHGKVVRLKQGRDEQATVYSDDPLEVMAQFQDAGAERVHIVDLDAAFGEPRQTALLARVVVAAKGEQIQLGGGLRTADLLRAALDSGFDRVVAGSMVVHDPAAFGRAAAGLPGRVIPALEFDDGRLRAAGWCEGTALGLEEVLQALLPFTGLFSEALVTDIARDGMLSGPNIDLGVSVARALGVQAIVSGGVAGSGDVVAAAVHSELSAVIVGRSFYDGRIDLLSALEALRSARAGVPA